MATIIKANGMVMQAYPKNGKTFELEELRDVVGGTIEIVSWFQKVKKCLERLISTSLVH